MKKFIIAIAVLLMLCGCEKSAEAQSGTLTETSSATTEAAHTTASETADSSILEAEDTMAEKPDFLFVAFGGKGTLKAYNGSETSVIIPEEIDGMPVTKYYYNAFEGSNVTEITFPSTITDITKLSGADKLETINLPKTLKSVTPRYIADCPNLQNINIESGGDFISDDGVLYSADGKTLVCFPAGRTGEFTVPDGVEVIGDNAFTGSKLTKVTLPKGVVRLGKYAFHKAQLSEIILPEGLAEIGNYAFADSGLKSIVLPNGLTKIGNSTFAGCQITEIALPEGLAEIGSSAFSQTKLTELYLPDSIESCGNILGSSSGDISVSAPLAAAYGREAEQFLALPNVTFRGDNDRLKAMRAAPKRYDREYYLGHIFIDVNGDKFPEMLEVYDYGEDEEHYYSYEAYWYNTQKSEWIHFWWFHNNENIELYYDKVNNEYFYLLREMGEYGGSYFHKKICTPSLLDVYEYIGGFDSYSIGTYFNEEYIVEDKVDFGTLNGKYYIGENEEDFLQNSVKDAMSEYELVFSIDIAELIPQESDEPFEITVGDLADTPQDSPYFSQKQEKEPLFTIGQEVCTEDTFWVHLNAEDATPENFEKLSLLPKLTTLNIGGRYGYGDKETPVDLNGIGVLTNLRELYVWGDITNAAEIGKLKNLSVLYMSSTADDFTFLTGMDSVVVMEFDDTTDKPEDFYEPLYGMKNMRCLLLSTWDINMTTEQYKHIKKNAPHIKIFMFKRG